MRSLVLLLLLGVALTTVSSLSSCRNRASYGCSSSVCGSGTYPVSSSMGLKCMKTCSLCEGIGLPTCALGYYDPGNDTCVPCSWRCHDATNCTSSVTCPEHCSSRHYGLACDKTCPSGCKGTCDRWTGLCIQGCVDGKWGKRCDKTCSRWCNNSRCLQLSGRCKGCASLGKWGNTCSGSCWRYCPSRICDQHGFCLRDCDSSYATAWGYTCHSRCGSRCSRCDSLSGKCLDVCANNHSNDFCLEECTPGKWGPRCDSTCPSHCPDSCQQLTGECGMPCYEGRWSADCSTSCPSGCKDGVCHRLTSQCLDCVDGKWGETCNLTCPLGCSRCPQLWSGCTLCKHGYFRESKNCTKCSSNCDGTCDRETGACPQCKRGYFGARCNYTCSSGCERSYYYSVPQCNQKTGYCSAGCVSTKYGDTCNNTCSANCKLSECKRKGDNLHCTGGCVDGHKGDYCQTACPSACTRCDERRCLSCRGRQWGVVCDQSCAAGCPRDCDVVTGHCQTDCTDGWTGAGCDGKCRDHCTKCTKSGVCLRCEAGWYGTTCQQSCPTCLEKACRKTNGYCTQGCLNGYYGDKCDRNCSATCRRESSDLDVCHRSYGSCSQGCVNGFWGNKCNRKCSSFCNRGAPQKQVCSQSEGFCLQGCHVGKYGDSCLGSCPAHCLNDTCHQDSGVCLLGCDPGWQGSYCDEACDEGSYGADCEQNCSATCREGTPRCYHVNGVCLHGCKPGWHGLVCSQAVGVPDWSLGVAALLSVLVSVLVLVIVFRYCRSKLLPCLLGNAKDNRSENIYEVVWNSGRGRNNNGLPHASSSSACAGSNTPGACAGETCSRVDNREDYDVLTFDTNRTSAKTDKEDSQEREGDTTGRAPAAKTTDRRSKSSVQTNKERAKANAGQRRGRSASTETTPKAVVDRSGQEDIYVNYPKFNRQEAIEEAKTRQSRDPKVTPSRRRDVPQPDDTEDELYENFTVTN